MSATAFQRLRREQAAKEQHETDNQSEYNALNIKELKALLDEKGIKYDARANKETLIKLLEGAE